LSTIACDKAVPQLPEPITDTFIFHPHYFYYLLNYIKFNSFNLSNTEFEISVPIVLRGAPDEILLPRKDRSFVIPITWRNRGAAIVISLRK